MCKSKNLKMFLDLGDIPIVDRFVTHEELNQSEKLYPLNVHLCKDCGLAQLGYIVPAEELFNENYAYESSTTKSRRKNHYELSDYICKRFNVPNNSLVADIGSNVGVLLERFKENGMRVIGIDASSNIVRKANERGIKTILGFFGNEVVERIIKVEGQAQVVTATNLFAHIQDYDSFIIALKKFLKEDGIFIFQIPHFLHLLKNTEYDTIYHEHVSYFGLKPLVKFFRRFNMELFDVLETEIDGGSLRCFVSNGRKYQVSKNVQRVLQKEEKEGIYSLPTLEKFASDVKKQKKRLLDLLIELKKHGKKVVGVGAPAKGITMINYCKIDVDILKYITEKSPLKIGKYTPGMHIPVKPDDVLLTDKPDYVIIFAWNFADEIIKNLETYQKEGGKFIIPIPTPKII